MEEIEIHFISRWKVLKSNFVKFKKTETESKIENQAW